MSSAVLDSSALLAVIADEPGADMVRPYLPNAIISSVNLSEVLSKNADVGVTLEQMQWSIGQLPIQCIAYDKEQAYITASMREVTRKQGLS